jgi:hypothetical protein
VSIEPAGSRTSDSISEAGQKELGGVWVRTEETQAGVGEERGEGRNSDSRCVLIARASCIRINI